MALLFHVGIENERMNCANCCMLIPATWPVISIIKHSPWVAAESQALERVFGNLTGREA